MRFQDGEEKQFIFRHARQIFDLIDEDGSGSGHSCTICQKFQSFCQSNFLHQHVAKCIKNTSE